MALNFSQNTQYVNQPQNVNFEATNIPVKEPASFSILKGMGLPTNGDEFVKFAPFFGVSVLFSKLISSFAVIASRVNPFKKGNEAITAGESFEKSILGRMTKKIDDFLCPILNRNKSKINSVKTTASRWTPKWIKNLGEKFSIGVAPKNSMALFNYRGATYGASNSFLELFAKVAPEELTRLGLNANALQEIAAAGMKGSTRQSVLGAVEMIADKLKGVSAKDLQQLALKTGKKVKLLDELNKARSFIAPTAKTGVSKYLQKMIMYLSEAAGGGVIGGALMGILMNSLFLATTMKRTWEAPWGEKLSTFMEGFFVEFGGIYLTFVLGTRLTYKLLGLKNADKTKAELEAIKALTKGINGQKEEFKGIEQLLKGLRKGNITAEGEHALKEFLRTVNPENIPPELKTLIDKTVNGTTKTGFFRRLFRLKPKANPPAPLTKETAINIFEQLKEAKGQGINTAIDNLAKMRKFQAKNGGFFRNLLNRPLRWVGNFLSMGLENLPTKVGVKGASKMGILWHKFANAVKYVGGYPLRFILITAIVTPPLTNMLGKFSHAVFGKPTKSIMDEKEEEKKGGKNASAQQQSPQNMDKMMAYSQLTKQVGELRKAYNEQQKAQLPQPRQNIAQLQPKPQTITQQAKQPQISQEIQPVLDKKKTSPATYVPQVAASRFIDEGTMGEIQQKLARSNSVERYAQKELEALHTKNAPYDF